MDYRERFDQERETGSNYSPLRENLKKKKICLSSRGREGKIK